IGFVIKVRAGQQHVRGIRGDVQLGLAIVQQFEVVNHEQGAAAAGVELVKLGKEFFLSFEWRVFIDDGHLSLVPLGRRGVLGQVVERLARVRPEAGQRHNHLVQTLGLVKLNRMRSLPIRIEPDFRPLPYMPMALLSSERLADRPNVMMSLVSWGSMPQPLSRRHSIARQAGQHQQAPPQPQPYCCCCLNSFSFYLLRGEPASAAGRSGAPAQRLSTDGVMRRSRHQLSSSLRAPWPGSLTPSLAARLCLLACAFVATAAAAASASKAAANSDAFLAAVLSLGPAPGQRPIINRAKRRSPPSPVELAPQLIDSLGLCPGDSDSVALAARLEALSAAWLRVRHCPHLPLATVLPMFPGQPGAEPLPGSAGNAFDTTKKFEFDAGVPPSGCSALLLGPAEATRALLLAASSTSGATTPAAVAASSSASPTASSSSGLVYNSSSFGGASLSSFIEDSPLLQPPLASSLAPSLTGALNLSRLLCQCARAVADRSDQLRAVSNHFGGLLNQMYFKAKSAHSQEHIESLKQCQIAYTDWLCSVYFTVHNTSREAWTVQAARGRFAEAAASALMQPCPDWCQAVETECPYLSPSEEMSNAGEPLFLCHGLCLGCACRPCALTHSTLTH
uniref:PDZ domain-containing protein n=1 Tax=Macrostomum lignano TaxID=282301 RepID=A0A1I8IM43_9PLAT